MQVFTTQRCTCPQVWLYEGKRTLGFFMQRRSPLQVLARELGMAQEEVVPTVMKQLLENLQVGGGGGGGGGKGRRAWCAVGGAFETLGQRRYTSMALLEPLCGSLCIQALCGTSHVLAQHAESAPQQPSVQQQAWCQREACNTQLVLLLQLRAGMLLNISLGC
jgi:hypothetical protein